MRWPVLFATAAALLGQDQASDPLRRVYASAITEYNSGRITQARTQLEKLLKEHPDYFRGYRVYWDAVGRTQDGAARRAAVERDLKLFEAASIENRTEEFYSNMIGGYTILDNPLRVSELQKECTQRHPRGLVAQQAVLDSARKESEPARAVQIYAKYIKDFPENISWVELATRDRFEVTAAHPEIFDITSLRAAADEAEQAARAYIGAFGNPTKLLAQLQRTTEVFAERDPAAAVMFAQRGLSMVQEHWPRSEEISEKNRIFFWPALLTAHVALKDWVAARRVGEALTKEIDSGAVKLGEAKERIIRGQYAQALQNSLLPEAARVQQELAADPSRDRKRREEQVRAALLAAAQRRPAKQFRLKDATERTISLNDLRGKVVALAFWATWCGPCIAELDQWKIAWKKYRDKTEDTMMLSISTDVDKGHAAQFAKERGYDFPILFSDGTIEEFYKAQTIPQFYLIDRDGDIRFHSEGYSSDGFYLQKLDWMIEAVLK
jgi:peroxiredoxin